MEKRKRTEGGIRHASLPYHRKRWLQEVYLCIPFCIVFPLIYLEWINFTKLRYCAVMLLNICRCEHSVESIILQATKLLAGYFGDGHFQIQLDMRAKKCINSSIWSCNCFPFVMMHVSSLCSCGHPGGISNIHFPIKIVMSRSFSCPGQKWAALSQIVDEFGICTLPHYLSALFIRWLQVS